MSFGTGVTTISGLNAPTDAGTGIALLVKYDSSGNAQWVRTTNPNPGNSVSEGIAIDSSDSIYTAGWLEYSSVQSNSFGFGTNVTATAHYLGGDVLLLRYNSSGLAQWAQSVSAGAVNTSRLHAVAVDTSTGSVFGAGSIDGTGSFGFGNSVSVAGFDSQGSALLVKY